MTAAPDRNTLAWLIARLDEVEATCAEVQHADLVDRDDPARVITRLRQLEVPPGGPELALRLRYRVRRRIVLHSSAERERATWRRRWRDGFKVASVAAVILGATLLGEALGARWAAPPRVDVRALPLPIVAARTPPRPAADDMGAYLDLPDLGDAAESEFFEQVDAATADVGADSILAWLGARNELDMLRSEFRQRFSRQGRLDVLVSTGVAPVREDRIQELATHVARRVEMALALEDPDPIALALGLRALLAAGSSRTVGEHSHLVRAATDHLLAVLADDPPEDLTVSVLAAITDVAVVSDGQAGETVRRQAERLVRATVDLGAARRPVLLHRQTRLASLADAGYVMRLAPAFGAPAGLCARVRRLVLAHLKERLDVSVERPDVVAAMLYGFRDLVDREDLDARLLLWGAKHLLPDYVALLHYAWGHYPVRRGWANFQDDLRYLSTLRTPELLEDAAALLLTWATNFAAPGSQELIARR